MSVEGDDVIETAADWLAEGRRLVLATVVKTWQSSPRPSGSQMLVDDQGRFAGSVSGGCVETSVIEAALEYLKKPRARTLSFGVTNEMAWEVGLPCGGKVEIFVGAANAEVLDRVLAARRARSTLALVTDLSSGEQRIVDPADVPGDLAPAVARLLQEPVSRAVHEVVEEGERRFFVQVLCPPLRLIIVGAVHLAQLLATQARLAGIPVVVIDPRTAFATEERFPGVELVFEWPGEALKRLELDRRAAVVTLSHDAKIDEPALAAALSSDCFYIGALGGRKTQAARRQRLRKAGFGDESLSRLHGPVGLDIGALTAPEIAVSIMAEIIEHWRRPRATDGRLEGRP